MKDVWSPIPTDEARPRHIYSASRTPRFGFSKRPSFGTDTYIGRARHCMRLAIAAWSLGKGLRWLTESHGDLILLLGSRRSRTRQSTISSSPGRQVIWSGENSASTNPVLHPKGSRLRHCVLKSSLRIFLAIMSCR